MYCSQRGTGPELTSRDLSRLFSEGQIEEDRKVSADEERWITIILEEGRKDCAGSGRRIGRRLTVTHQSKKIGKRRASEVRATLRDAAVSSGNQASTARPE